MTVRDTGYAPRTARLETALRQSLLPISLEIADESAHHAGHAGARTGGETHYKVIAVSDRFTGLPRLARSRLVHEILADEFATGLHALSLILRSPDEA